MSTSTTRKATTVKALSILLALPMAVVLHSGTASATELHEFSPSNVGATTGHGNGKVAFKTGAGSVGKADDKSPRGQSLNDNNNGYECELTGNRGIGPTNPAHTGCEAFSVQYETID